MNTLIDCITSPPILAYLDYNAPFTVNTNTSQSGRGAVLYQYQSETLRVIAYASRTLTKGKGITPYMLETEYTGNITCLTSDEIKRDRIALKIFDVDF